MVTDGAFNTVAAVAELAPAVTSTGVTGSTPVETLTDAVTFRAVDRCGDPFNLQLKQQSLATEVQTRLEGRPA